MRRSFSLVEVIITIFILVLILAAVFPFFQEGFSQARQARNQAVALGLIQEKLEAISANNQTQVEDPALEEECLDLGFTAGEYEPVFKQLCNAGLVRATEVTEVVEDMDGSGDPELSRVQVRVSWGNQEIEIITLEAKY